MSEVAIRQVFYRVRLRYTKARIFVNRVNYLRRKMGPKRRYLDA